MATREHSVPPGDTVDDAIRQLLAPYSTAEQFDRDIVSRLLTYARDKFASNPRASTQYDAALNIVTGEYLNEEPDPAIATQLAEVRANKGIPLQKLGYDVQKATDEAIEQYLAGRTDTEKRREEKERRRRAQQEQSSAGQGELKSTEQRKRKRSRRRKSEAEQLPPPPPPDSGLDLADIARRLPEHPCTEFLCSSGYQWTVDNAEGIIQEVITNIEDRCLKHHDQMVRKGRTQAGKRVALTNQSLADCMRVIFESKQRIRSRVEALLERFVRWNLGAFPEMTERINPLASGPFDDMIELLQDKDGLVLDAPLTLEKAEQTAEAIFDVVVARFTRKVPSSARFIPPKGPGKKEKKRRKLGPGAQVHVSREERYSLAPVEGNAAGKRFNFKDTLKACFTDQHDILEALEVEVYRLAELEHKAFPELTGWPEA